MTTTLDLFETEVLIEASWHSGTILRHSIMQRAINEWYHLLSTHERACIYEFFARTHSAEDEIQNIFMARYNPANQYMVHVEFEGQKETRHCFLFNGQYRISDTGRADERYITSALKIEPKP